MSAAVSTSLLLFPLNLRPGPGRQPVPLAGGRIEIAAGEGAASATSTLPPASCSCSTWRVDRG